MAGFKCLVIFLLAILAFVSCEVNQAIPDSAKNCENSCLKTFPSEKSNTVDKLSDACQRGCRFFVLVNSVAALRTNDVPVLATRRPPIPIKTVEETNEVASEPVAQTIVTGVTSTPEPIPSARTNSSKEACQASCMEAYRHTRERYACHEGCANMARESARAEDRARQALLAESARELASLAAVGPLLSSMFGQLYAGSGPRFAVVVSTGDEIASSEDVFLFERPEAPIQHREIFLHSSDSEPDDVLTDPAFLRQLEDTGSVEVRLPEQRVRTFPAISSETRHPTTHQHSAVPADLLACLSTRYGVPKWLLGLLALVTGIMTAWLCLEPWDRAAILDETVSDKTLLVDTDEEEDDKIPLPSDMVKIPLEKA